MSQVEVYYNLHKKCWSVRDRKTKRVVAHAVRVDMRDCTFHASAAGRERVRREKRKNVHAYVRGTLVNLDGATLTVHGSDMGYDVFCDAPRTILTQVFSPKITYNPYRNETFVDKQNGNKITACGFITMRGKAVYYGRSWETAIKPPTLRIVQ